MLRPFLLYGMIGLFVFACNRTPLPQGDLAKLQSQILLAVNTEAQQQLAQQWWEEYRRRGLPFVHDSTALFLYKGAAKSLRLAGDMTSWQPGPEFQRLGETDLFALEQQYPDSARLDYKFVVDSTWTLDPANPHQMLSGFGPNSELRMPRYQPLAHLDGQPPQPTGKIETFTMHSRALNNQRPIRVYLPPGYAESQVAYPTLYVNDGLDYLEFAQLQRTLDYLIYNHEIRPLVAVCVPPIKEQRRTEYGNNPRFAEFICAELLPRLQRRYRVIDDPDHRAILGASFGGLISFYIALQNPAVFRRAAGQSSYFDFNDGEIFSLLQKSDAAIYKFYISCGTYETNVNNSDSFIDMHYRMREALRMGRARFGYHEVAAGHSWGFWRDDLPRLLKYLFPAEKVAEGKSSILNLQFKI